MAGALLFAVGRAFGQVVLPVLFLGDALLGFEDEVTAPVDVNESSAALVSMGKCYGSLKTIVVV